ncbi:MAG: radical SAM protein [Elusimicrobiales bacterium]
MKNNNQCYEILLNYSCNASCIFCSQADYDRTKKASFDDIVKQIYKAKKEGYIKLGLSGGEPTIRDDLPQIIKTARKIGFSFIRIQTNGILLENYEFAKKLVEAGLTFCKFSFTSHIPKIHNILVKREYAWEKAMKGLENMKKLKVRIGNNILVNKCNILNIEKTVKFFLDKGVSNFVIIYPIYTGNMYINRDIGVSLGKCKKHFLNLIEMMKKNGLSNEILFLNVPPCFLDEYYQQAIGLSPFNTLVTSPDGRRIDLDENANEEKIKGKICEKCMLYKICKGVDRKYIEIFGWEDFMPLKSENDKKKKQKFSKEYLTDNEKCLIEILKRKNNIDTQTVLKIAKKIPLCQDCTDGNNVINAAAKLVNKKIIQMEFIKGKYYFKLLKNQESI